MHWVMKTATKQVYAWRLGEHSAIEEQLLHSGKLVHRPDGTYEVFSYEATGAVGEVAQPGDYFKVDNTGCPYPINRESFERTHRQIGDDLFEQLAEPLQAWTSEEPISEEIDYLMKEKGLELHPETPDQFFRAPLWGTLLTAAKDAVLVFYHTNRDKSGKINDADYNFVARTEFNMTYRVV